MSPRRYDVPFHWWGPGWDQPAIRDLGQLLRDGTLDVPTAALLWAALARRSSLAVAAGPRGAGKTTLLTAFLALLPTPTRRIYLRGNYETFDFLADPAVIPKESVLLVNEISPHLPIYVWGPAVTRALAATEGGFQLLTTMHARSIPEFVALLTGSPLRVPAPLVAAVEFVLFLEQSTTSRSGFRAREVSRLAQTDSGVAFESWPPPKQPRNGPRLSAQAPSGHAWFPDAELNERGRILEDLRLQRIDALPD